MDHTYQFNQFPMQEFLQSISYLEGDHCAIQKMATLSFCSLAIQWEDVEDVLEEYQIQIDSRDKSSICKESVNLIEGNLRHGFHFVDEKILLITEHEIFQKKLKRRFRRQHASNTELLKDFIMNLKRGLRCSPISMELVNI